MIIFTLLVFFLLFLTPNEIKASDEKFINIVNPVRVSPYNSSSIESITSQHSVVKSLELPATWLLTYDVLNNADLVNFIKTFDKNQEIGVFVEVTEDFTENAEVPYDLSLSWHHAQNIFLTGYNKSDRIKLIDLLFKKYKEVFGVYPRSVGGWWIDSYSLAYMKDKYGITTNLGLSDQYSTDGYRVWGTPWGVPFYPSRFHSGIAADYEDSLKILTVQWAPRDPLRGYYDSYYSTQDYLQTREKLDIGYFEKLLEFYLNGEKGQVTVGLEGDLSPEAYNGEYKNQLEIVKKLEKEKKARILTLSQLADTYKPGRVFSISEDLLGENKKAFWFSNSIYRIGAIYDINKNKLEILDVRSFPDDFEEPYYTEINKGVNLLISIPSLIDSFSDNSESISIDTGNLKEVKSDETITLIFEKGQLELGNDYVNFDIQDFDLPERLKHNSHYDLSNKRVSFNSSFPVNQNGFVFSSLPESTIRFLERKRTKLISALFLTFWIFTLLLVYRKKYKLGTLLVFFLPLFAIFSWYYKNTSNYFVSQSEIEALLKLAVKPEAKVLVYEESCLGCEWNSEFKPAVFENKRQYVRKWSKKAIVQNQKIFETEERTEAKRAFDESQAKYIYVVKYGKYAEKVPFSPGDLGVEKIYDNANAEIWQKVN